MSLGHEARKDANSTTCTYGIYSHYCVQTVFRLPVLYFNIPIFFFFLRLLLVHYTGSIPFHALPCHTHFSGPERPVWDISFHPSPSYQHVWLQQKQWWTHRVEYRLCMCAEASRAFWLMKTLAAVKVSLSLIRVSLSMILACLSKCCISKPNWSPEKKTQLPTMHH